MHLNVEKEYIFDLLDFDSELLPSSCPNLTFSLPPLTTPVCKKRLPKTCAKVQARFLLRAFLTIFKLVL